MPEGDANLTQSLSPAQFARVKALFNELVEQTPDAQRQALAALADDAPVHAELRRLLAHSGQTLNAAPLKAAVAEVIREPNTGSTLGAWTLQEPIGAGGMGKVFRAQRSDGHFQQQAAVKLLSGVPSAAALRTLARERQILATLTHPNIARLLDGGSTQSGQPYLVMEFVEGLPLLDYCAQHALSLSARIQLLRELCAAVGFAHQRLVVHCDLKPSNILVTASGRPMLLDFGISRLLEEVDSPASADDVSASSHSGLTQLSYTPRYASPEQKGGKPVGTATDVYSMGLVIAETLAAPWPLSQTLPDLSSLPTELAAIVQKATATSAEQRYLSMDQLADDLRRYLTREAVQAVPAQIGYRLRKWLWRHWVPVSVGTAFIVLLSGFSWQMRVERDSAQAAERAARAVKDYMVSVFQGADPEQGGRRDLPVSQFLDAGRQGLQNALIDQPATRLELAIILGAVYQNIGQRQQAVALYDEAIAVAKAERLPLAEADALHRKAYSLYDMEDLSAALPVAREALALRARLQPDSSAHLASLRLLGSILSYQGDFAAAEPPLQEALRRANIRFGADSLDAALAHLDLARHEGAQMDRPQSVLNHATIAGKLFRERLGPEHFRVADALEVHILGQYQAGQAAAAVADAAELVARRRKLYGDLSYPHSYALQTQGSTLRRAGQSLAAIAPLKASLAIDEQLDGPLSVGSQVPRLSLAFTLDAAGLYSEAAQHYQDLLRIQRAHPDNAKTSDAQLQLWLATAQRFSGEAAQAEQALRPLLKELLADAASDPTLRAEFHIELAALARERRGYAEAQAELDAIDPQIASSQFGYFAERARLAMAQGQLAAAKADLDQAVTLATSREGAEALATRMLQIDRAQWLQISGDRQAAKALAATTREQLKDELAPEGHWRAVLDALDPPVRAPKS